MSNPSKAELKEKEYGNILVSPESPVDSRTSYNGDDQLRKNDIEATLGFRSQDERTHLPKRSFFDKLRSNTSMVGEPGPPPDGGRIAWTQAIMAHLLVFNAWGYVQSFGVFQTYFTSTLHLPPSNISWIGSIQIFLLFAVGTFSGRALDAGLFKVVFFSGIVLQLFGVCMTSLSTKYWQIFLAQGIAQGIGNGLQFCPTMALLSTYFSTNRSIALGIAATGSSTGGLVYPAIVRALQPKIGFAWTVRVCGLVMAVVGLIAGSFLRPRLPPRKAGPLVEFSAFKELPYTLFLVASFLNFWGLFFGFYYVSSYGRDILGISYEESISILMVMNGIGATGRLLPNIIADRVTGPLNLMIPFVFSTALITYCWAAVTTRGGLWAFAGMYGLIASGLQGLFPAILSSLTTDLSKQGVRMGMGFTFVGIASATGPPLAGALIQSRGGSYLDAQMWAASSILAGGMVLVAARWARIGWTWTRI